jgi:hypothetical protein
MWSLLSSRWSSVAVAGLVVALTLFGLASCGTQGYAPPLSGPKHATLSSASGSRSQAGVLLTPFDALHVIVYYRGDKLPASSSLTPAQLRENSCVGSLVAPITGGDSLPAGTAEFAPDPAGGMDVSVAPSANLYVVVLRTTGDPSSAGAILACGAPLSGRSQYFDLYPPQTGNAGIGLGTALMSPIVATRLDFTMSSGEGARPSAWEAHTGSCTGSVLASGQIKANITRPSGVIYQAQGAHPWWITLTLVDSETLCGEVSSHS